jgi:large subunit ribosomal protein L29
MKKTTLVKELKNLSKSELKERARSISEEIMKIRFRKAVGQMEGANKLGALRKDLARVLTVFSSSEQ